MCGQTYSWMRTQLQLLTSQINLDKVHASCQPVKLTATVSKWMRHYLNAAETWFYRGIMKTPWGNESFMKKTYKGYWLLEQERDNPHSLYRSRGEYWGMLWQENMAKEDRQKMPSSRILAWEHLHLKLLVGSRWDMMTKVARVQSWTIRKQLSNGSINRSRYKC